MFRPISSDGFKSMPPAVVGILHIPLLLSPFSSTSFPVWRSDSPLFFTPDCSNKGILSSPRFSIRLPSSPPLRRSDPPEVASSTPVSRLGPRSAPATPLTHCLFFSPFLSVPSPLLPSPSPPVFAMLPSSPFLPSLPVLLALLHSLPLHL